MSPGLSDRLIVGGAAAFALTTTAVLIWPIHYDIAEPLLETASALPALTFTVGRAALDTPLFSDTRTPAPPTPTPGASPTSPAPSLVGIAASRRSAVALLRSAAGETIAQVGDIVDGWTVMSISRDQASLRRGAEAKDLTLDFSGDVGAHPAGSSSVSSSPAMPVQPTFPPPNGHDR